MRLLARLLAVTLWTCAAGAPSAALLLWPAPVLAEDDESDACGDQEEDVDPPSDEPEDPEPDE